MADGTATIEKFVATFRDDPENQAEYMRDPVAFLRESDLPEEYASDLIANLEEQQRMRMQLSGPEPVGVMQGAMPDEGLMMGAPKGKPHLSIQKSTNRWSWVTGYYLVLNNQLTDDISDGLIATAALAGMLNNANPELISKAFAYTFAAALFAEASAMKLLNRGKGVYYYLNPLLIGTPALLISLAPLPN